jgi:hypothetical protein
VYLLKPVIAYLPVPYTFDVPPGRMIGTVTEIVKDNSSNFYNLKVKTSADFYKLPVCACGGKSFS